MAIMNLSFFISFALFAMCTSNLKGSLATNDSRKIYIVYMGSLPSDPNYSPKAHHMAMLQEVVQTSNAAQSLMRSYTKSFNGFAANLTDAEAKKLSAKEEVVSIFPSRTLQLHTTKSWDFMGFTQSAPRNLTHESDIIVGVLDTGIWPESKSFSDHGFGPVPKKWKGECNGGQNFTCNKKLIGAQNYVSEPSCRDMVGHGSHTSSTAAGNYVENVSFYGMAKGTARGGVPSARIAMYKVCISEGCSEDAILSGFDQAIADGVDILSISLGRSYPVDITDDTIAIASFHASQKGILTVHSAGNSGPNPGQISSNAPWLFSIAASTINRKFVTKVQLGNGKTIVGSSVNSFELKGTQIAVINGVDASRDCELEVAKECTTGCLVESLVKGKILICEKVNIAEAFSVGAIGLIALQDESSKASDYAIISPYPVSVMKSKQFALAQSYYNSTKNPTMKILKSENAKDSSAPAVAGFSSRGPSNIPNILKPDITAPGVDILAAYSPATHPSDYYMDTRSTPYSILSGTSMACPHVTGAAAYIKSLHPGWSPSAIKSALMTSASTMKSESTKEEDEDNEFAYGTGHLDPLKASNPGVVYETTEEDYIKMICGMNITSSTAISKMFSYNISCGDVHDTINPKDLNYPSMTARIDDTIAERFNVEFSRKLTNVGLPSSTYKATISCNYGNTCNNVNISVEPDTLIFRNLNEQKSFVVKVDGKKPDNIASASLEWSDGTHTARSPIVVYV